MNERPRDTDSASRITELEVRIAYQDDVIRQLDEVVRDFAARVEVLERRVAELAAVESDEVGPAQDLPPHY